MIQRPKAFLRFILFSIFRCKIQSQKLYLMYVKFVLGYRMKHNEETSMMGHRGTKRCILVQSAEKWSTEEQRATQWCMVVHRMTHSCTVVQGVRGAAQWHREVHGGSAQCCIVAHRGAAWHKRCRVAHKGTESCTEVRSGAQRCRVAHMDVR